MKTNRAVRRIVKARVVVMLVAVLALGAFELRGACRWYQRLGASVPQTLLAQQVCSTDLGATMMWAGR